MKKLALLSTLVCFGVMAIFPLGSAQAKPGWPKSVAIGAAPSGGTYYIWAGGFAALLRDKMGLEGEVVVTGGPVHNTRFVHEGKLDFGLVTAGPVWEGFYGQGWAKGKKYQNVRVIFPMYRTYFQMYSLAKTGIKSIHDLNGKRVGIGPAGGTPGTYWPIILNLAGIKAGRLFNATSAAIKAQVTQGILDANGQAVGLPWVTVFQIEKADDINLYGVPSKDADKFIEKFPYFAKGLIPKGTYKCNKDHNIDTLSMWNFMTVGKDTPDDFVYEVLKKTFENLDILIATHKSAVEVEPENILFSPIPLHPGAVKYYREKGITIPEKLIAR
jgi:TRAP transporter TAXI family solute receptor